LFYLSLPRLLALYDNKHSMKVDRSHKQPILNFINGKRTVTMIRNLVIAETDRDLDFKSLMRYLDFLKAIGWITC